MANDNRTLGRFILDGILPAPRGVPQIEVSFDIDANGILSVKAKDKGTGKEQKITITASSGLSKEDIDKMQREHEAHASEDAKRKEEVEAKNTGDNMAYSADEKMLNDNKDKIPEEAKKEIESKIAAVRTALQVPMSRISSRRRRNCLKLCRKPALPYTDSRADSPGRAPKPAKRKKRPKKTMREP
jgi:molecular chaperone DnaK